MSRTPYAKRRNLLIAQGRWQPQQFTGAAPVRAHLRKLGKAKVSRRQAALRSGVSESLICRVLYGEPSQGGRVQAATAQAIRRLYDELWDQDSPMATTAERIAAAKARAYAERRRWAPPAAWDDDNIDRPSARPLGVGRAKP